MHSDVTNLKNYRKNLKKHWKNTSKKVLQRRLTDFVNVYNSFHKKIRQFLTF